MRTRLIVTAAAVLAVALIAGVAAIPAFAQDGKLKIRVTPKQSHVFVDGRAMGWGSRTWSLAAGQHDVAVYNYGFKAYHGSVSIQSGATTTLDVTLEAVGADVPGPFGRIQIEGAPGDSAVLLNGKTPDYHVGHSDEFNHDTIWKQELLVRPGSHLVTIVQDRNEIWSGEVTVAENQRTIVNVKSGQQNTTNWSRGTRFSSAPRFKAGTASATIAIAPTTIPSFTANPQQINCLDSSRLAWQTTEAVEVNLQGDKVDLNGEKLVEPHATTTYDLNAAGPGGRVQKSVTVNVNIEVVAKLSAAPSEIRYRRIGDRVVEHGTSTLTWSASNANQASIDPGVGSVNATSGSRGVQPAPKQTDIGPVSESVTYTLNATNPCGGRGAASASVRITGSIEPIPEVVLASVFFPTDYPDRRNPNLGLVASQKRALGLLVDGFKKYLEYDPDAKLHLEAHADERNSVDYNRELSGRRAAIVKQHLVDAGLAGDQITSQTFGEDQPLDRSAVEGLEAQNPNAAPAARARNKRGDWLAHNRRVDIVLRPTGTRSLRYYPHNEADSGILWQVPKPPKSKVEAAQ
jgi:outer membrane protein OmpA-like peptidoglycan-associated protein